MGFLGAKYGVIVPGLLYYFEKIRAMENNPGLPGKVSFLRASLVALFLDPGFIYCSFQNKTKLQCFLFLLVPLEGYNWAASSEFVSSSIPPWQILTAHAQPFRGARIWLSVWRFLLTQCLYERAAEVLARLRGCAGSPEPSLLAYAISTKFAWRGLIYAVGFSCTSSVLFLPLISTCHFVGFVMLRLKFETIN